MEVFIFIREISKATALLIDIRAEVKTALDLINGQCPTTEPTIVLLSDALRRIDECAALPNVQALPDRPPYKKEYHTLTPDETGSADTTEDKTEAPPVKMVIQDASRRFDGEIP